MKRSSKLLGLIAAATLVLSGCANKEQANNENASDYPSQTVKIILPYSAGGDTDLNARMLAPYLSEEWGQPVVVSNMTGASGTVASDFVKDAKGDGYNVMFNHNNVVINPLLGVTEHSYDAFSVAGTVVSDTSTGLVVPADAPYDDLTGFIAAAKKQPGEMIFGTQIGAFTSLLGYVLEDKADIDLNVVDVGGASEQVNELLGGRTQISAIPYGLVKDHVEAKNLKVLAIFAENRNAALPEIPTVKESGVDITWTRRYGAFLPKDTPENIVSDFSSGLEAVSKNSEYQSEVEKLYMTVEYLDSKAATDYYKEMADAYAQYKSLLSNKS